MIIESSGFHSGTYERYASRSLINVEVAKKQWIHQPVFVYVGGGFLKFIQEEIDSEQKHPMLEGILSGSLGQSLVLNPWFKQQDMDQIKLEFLIKFVRGADSKELLKSWLREKAISVSRLGLVIPVSEITNMGRNTLMT